MRRREKKIDEYVRGKEKKDMRGEEIERREECVAVTLLCNETTLPNFVSHYFFRHCDSAPFFFFFFFFFFLTLFITSGLLSSGSQRVPDIFFQRLNAVRMWSVEGKKEG